MSRPTSSLQMMCTPCTSCVGCIGWRLVDKQENTDDPEMFQLKKRRNKYAPRGLGFGGQQGFFRSTESVFHVPSSA